MTPRKKPDLMLPTWATVVLAFTTLSFLLWMAINEPVMSDADDCLSRSKASDCWRDTGKEVYDLGGNRQP